MSIVRAIDREDVGQLESILAAGQVDVNAGYDEWRPPLQLATQKGNLAIVKLLVKHGAAVNAQTPNGETPLHCAAKIGAVDVATFLLQMNAEVDAVSNDGSTALREAACSGHVDTIRVLLKHGAAIDSKNMYDNTPLHYAASNGHAEAARVLLEAGAAVDEANAYARTLLHYASMNGHVDAVRVLLKAGATVDVENLDGRTALHYASAKGHVEIVRLLVEAGAAVDAKNLYGKTALHYASRHGHVDTVRLLLVLGATVNAIDTDKKTPLMLAIDDPEADVSPSQMYHVARTLCDSGAQWDADTPDTRSAYQDETGPKVRAGLRACVQHWVQQRSADASTDLIEVPEETYIEGAEAVYSYLESLAKTEASNIVRRRKLCVIGPSCSGKTSFVKSLSQMRSVTVDAEDRTIGIDLFALAFDDESPEANGDSIAGGKYEASIWDFAGQDIYQVAHTLYFSKRTLYLVFVNMKEYAKQLEQLLVQSVNDADASISRWVQDNVFCWVRLVLARQPDAELVVVCSKADTVSADQAQEVLGDLQSRLEEWAAQFVSEMEGPSKQAVEKCMHELQERARLRVSVVKQDTVESALHDLQRVVTENRERAFVMPHLYTHVLEAIKKVPSDLSATTDPTDRVRKLLVPSATLIARLAEDISGLKEHDCRHILLTFHNLGDILWYEQEHRLATLGLDTVMLDPRIMLDIVREVVNHTLEEAVGQEYDALRDRGELKHSLLQTFKLWGVLCRQSQDLVLYFKQLLQRFNLAYPMGNQDMAWDSDLIVPAYWKLKKQPLEGDPTTIDGRGLTWQYTLPAEVCETLFDQFIVQSYSVGYERTVSATQVVITKPRHSTARIVHHEGRKPSEDVISITVAADAGDECWTMMKLLVLAMEQVLHGYPGLGTVHRHLVLQSASGKAIKYDLRRVIEKGGGRVTVATFSLIQERFSVSNQSV